MLSAKEPVIRNKFFFPETVHQHRHDAAQRKVSLAVLVAPPVVGELGVAVEIAHEHTEDRMAGHSRDRAHKAGRKAVAVDILHVLERGKAERDHDGIDDRVELEVERRAAPRRAQKQELARLLREPCDNERLEEIAEVHFATHDRLCRYRQVLS